MTGLIEEIQLDALDKSTPVDALLRKMKLAAAKLNLGNIENWVEQELNGYSNGIPEYRILIGSPSVWNPYNGWIPIHWNDEKGMELISTANIGQSISSIQDLVSSGDTGVVHYPMPQNFINMLNEKLNFKSPRMIVQLSRGHLIGILDRIRNKCLDWAIEMEKKGIKGDGISFNSKELETAKKIETTINIGSIESFAGNLGNENSLRDINTGSVNIEKIQKICADLGDSKEELSKLGVDANNLQSILDQLVDETSTKKPNNTKLKNLLNDARTAVTAASGTVLGEGALALISAAINAVGG